jgi:DnaD/phage-associated family protein
VTFAGFPARAKATAIPKAFFSDVAPALTGPGALAVAVFAFHLLGAKRGFPRYLARADFARDAGLHAHLAALGDPAELLDAGLQRATETGLLLRMRAGGQAQEWLYFLNTPADRRGMETARRLRAGAPLTEEEDSPMPDRRSIFALYESLVGAMGPGIADELAGAERLYPPEWIEAAFHEAAQQNVRSWRYITRILERWAIEGRDHAQTDGDPAGGRYFAGKYGRILKQRMGR